MAELVTWVVGLLAVLLVLATAPLRAQTYNNAVVGYAQVGSLGGTSSASNYNAAGGGISASHSSTGVYTVTFEYGGNILDGGGHVQVSPYNDESANCLVGGWSGAPDLNVVVWCRNHDGNPIDSGFSVLVLDKAAPGTGDNENLAFAWSALAAPPGGELDLSSSDYTHNPGGGATTLYRDDIGRYRVVFGNLANAISTSDLGYPQVAAYGSDTRSCVPTTWDWDAGDLEIVIWCGDHDRILRDARFNVLITSKEEVAPGYAYAHIPYHTPPSTTTELSTAYNPFGSVEVSGTPDGLYAVRFHGVDTAGSGGGNIIVTPASFLNGTVSCGIVQRWITGGEDHISVQIQCWDQDGTPVVGTFTVLSTFVDAMPVADEATPAQLADGLTAPSPNPVRGTMSFAVAVERSQTVTVEIFDALGRRVRTLYDAPLAAGMSETLSLDASALPAGVYVIRATGEDFTKSRRFTVVK